MKIRCFCCDVRFVVMVWGLFFGWLFSAVVSYPEQDFSLFIPQ